MIGSVGRRLVLFLLAVAVVAAPQHAGAAESPRITLQVLSTTDLHMTLMDYDYYGDRPEAGIGLTRVASLIRQARAANPNTLLVDAGDLIQGTPMGDYVAREQGLPPGTTHPAIAAMNLLGYDAAALGNHEFNFGLEFLRDAYRDAKFPVLSANVLVVDGDQDPANDKTLYAPSALLERTLVDSAGAKHTVKVGIIGVLPPQIMVWDKDKLEGRVAAIDMVDAAAKAAQDLRRRGAVAVVAVAHSGLSGQPREGMDENGSAYLAQVPGIDAVVTGHSHRVFPGPDYEGFPGADIAKGTLHGKPVVMSGFFGSHLGVIRLELERKGKEWAVVGGGAETKALMQRVDGRPQPTTTPDAEVTALLRHDHDNTLAYVRRAVGRTTGRIESYMAHLGDSPGLDLVAQAQRRFVETQLKGTPHAGLPILSAAAPFKAGGRPGVDYYTDIPAGQFALRNVADLYLYPNTVTAVVVTGAQVREWLEMSARIFNTIDPAKTEPQRLVNGRVPSYNFDVLDGVTYRIDVTKPPRYDQEGKLVAADSRRILDLAYQGKPVADDQRFVVVTNNYRANGGGTFPGLDGSNIVYSGTETIQQLIADHIRQIGVVEPSTNRTWSFAPVPDNPTILYDSSPKAQELLSRYPNVTYQGPGENGFSVYKVDLSAKAVK
ncbi:MAG TPA: bifunctional 2',3'-cyclic-nucleotide 2'-phosphodiesterase/3'-nucleotidase [Azospirillaceae bacterium]|nr:bifunctional 2',3'-cyclic-nucleotide 2'-phosphodiesterase/3'-nucleotidase [Azospirillaceae bacterium]